MLFTPNSSMNSEKQREPPPFVSHRLKSESTVCGVTSIPKSCLKQYASAWRSMALVRFLSIATKAFSSDPHLRCTSFRNAFSAVSTAELRLRSSRKSSSAGKSSSMTRRTSTRPLDMKAPNCFWIERSLRSTRSRLRALRKLWRES